jgi:hypothetical protein
MQLQSTISAIQTKAIALTTETITGARECLSEVLSYDNVVAVCFALPRQLREYDRAAGEAVQRFTVAAGRFLWAALLIAIAFVLIGAEHWQNRSETIPVFRSLIRERINVYRETGEAAIEQYLMIPVEEKIAAWKI